MATVYYAAKTKEQLEHLRSGMKIELGRNVSSPELLAHVSMTPFKQGEFALDVIGKDTNEAWILELEIPDDIKFEDDPSGEGAIYGGDWKVSREPIRILRIISETHIPNVREWEFSAMTEPKEKEKLEKPEKSPWKPFKLR